MSDDDGLWSDEINPVNARIIEMSERKSTVKLTRTAIAVGVGASVELVIVARAAGRQPRAVTAQVDRIVRVD